MPIRVVIAFALLSLAACAGNAVAPSSSATPSNDTAARAASSSPASCPTTDASGGYPHQAPEIEAILPAVVAGRPLTRWSVRGRCWLEILIDDPAEVDPFAARFKTDSNPNPLDEANLVYGVAGRSDTKTDPPFFVYAAVRPDDEAEIALALVLLLAGGGFPDPASASDLSRYEEVTVAGKQVYAGSLEMVHQDTHQRGRPFLYQTDDHMFLVITDDDAWATDAIGQLP